MKDWRADVSEIDNLYDCDPACLLVFLRHQYLETAKDLKDEDWLEMGEQSCQVAESIQEALEHQMSPLTIEKF